MLVPTPKASIGAPVARRSAILCSSSPPLAKIWRPCPAASRMDLAPWPVPPGRPSPTARLEGGSRVRVPSQARRPAVPLPACRRCRRAGWFRGTPWRNSEGFGLGRAGLNKAVSHGPRHRYPPALPGCEVRGCSSACDKESPCAFDGGIQPLRAPSAEVDDRPPLGCFNDPSRLEARIVWRPIWFKTIVSIICAWPMGAAISRIGSSERPVFLRNRIDVAGKPEVPERSMNVWGNRCEDR